MFDTIHCMHWYTIIRSKISIEVSVSVSKSEDIPEISTARLID